MIQLMTAATGGTRKNNAEVLDAELCAIRYMRIVNAPNDTAKTCQLIAKTSGRVASSFGGDSNIPIKIT